MGEIGKKVRKLRIAKNLTQKQLGENLGYAVTTVSNWETMANREPDRKAIVGAYAFD